MSESKELIRKEINEIMEEIEELLLEMIEIQENNSKSDSKVVTTNLELGAFLNMYKEMLMKSKGMDQERERALA